MPKNKYIQGIINKFFISKKNFSFQKDFFTIFFSLLMKNYALDTGKKEILLLMLYVNNCIESHKSYFFSLYIIDITYIYLLKKPIFGPRETAFLPIICETVLNHATKYRVRVLQTVCARKVKTNILSLSFKK